MNVLGQPFVSCRLVNWLDKCECTKNTARAAQSPLFHAKHGRDPLAGNRAANFEPAFLQFRCTVCCRLYRILHG